MELLNKEKKTVPMSTKEFVELLEQILYNHPEVNDYPIFCCGHPVIWVFSQNIGELKEKFNFKDNVTIVIDQKTTYNI